MTARAGCRRGKGAPVDKIIGSSSQISGLRAMIDRVAASSASVMITGPSGAGKEVAARAIHAASDRAGMPFVAINCGAIPPDLLESELFGHERGSFTGAHTRRIGRFEEANGGTLLLDEIGDMRFDMQVKLLRVLEERTITRVGGTAALPVDVRIISATHRDIEAAIADKSFREDLFFRLGVVPLELPDLASRFEDIPLLIEHFQRGKPACAIARFNDSALLRLSQHGWPGNVRELRNIVERANILFVGQVLSAKEADLLLGKSGRRPLVLAARGPGHTGEGPAPAPPLTMPAPRKSAPHAAKMPIDLKRLTEEAELERIETALDLADGVIAEAARLLTLKRTTLIEKMRKYGVDRAA